MPRINLDVFERNERVANRPFTSKHIGVKSDNNFDRPGRLDAAEGKYLKSSQHPPKHKRKPQRKRGIRIRDCTFAHMALSPRINF